MKPTEEQIEKSWEWFIGLIDKHRCVRVTIRTMLILAGVFIASLSKGFGNRR